MNTVNKKIAIDTAVRIAGNLLLGSTSYQHPPIANSVTATEMASTLTEIAREFASISTSISNKYTDNQNAIQVGREIADTIAASAEEAYNIVRFSKILPPDRLDFSPYNPTSTRHADDDVANKSADQIARIIANSIPRIATTVSAEILPDTLRFTASSDLTTLSHHFAHIAESVGRQGSPSAPPPSNVPVEYQIAIQICGTILMCSDNAQGIITETVFPELADAIRQAKQSAPFRDLPK